MSKCRRIADFDFEFQELYLVLFSHGSLSDYLLNPNPNLREGVGRAADNYSQEKDVLEESVIN